MANDTDLSAQDADKTDEALWKEFETAETADGDEDGAAPAEDASAEWADEKADQTPQSDPSQDDPQSPPAEAGAEDSQQDDPNPTPATVDPEDLKKQIEDRELRIADLEQKWRSRQGRETAFQTRYEEAQQRIRDLEARLEGRGSQPDDTPSDQDRAAGEGDAPADKKPRNKFSTEQMAALREDYPDLQAMFDVLEDLTTSQQQDEEFRQQAQQEREMQEDQRRQEEWEKFASVHQDGMGFVHENWADFQQWLDDQPGAIRRIAESNMQHLTDGERTAMIVSRFKEAKGQTPKPGGQQQDTLPPKRRKQLEGTSGPTSNGRTPIRNGPPADMSEEAAWNYWARVEKEQDRRA